MYMYFPPRTAPGEGGEGGLILVEKKGLGGEGGGGKVFFFSFLPFLHIILIVKFIINQTNQTLSYYYFKFCNIIVMILYQAPSTNSTQPPPFAWSGYLFYILERLALTNDAQGGCSYVF